MKFDQIYKYEVSGDFSKYTVINGSVSRINGPRSVSRINVPRSVSRIRISSEEYFSLHTFTRVSLSPRSQLSSMSSSSVLPSCLTFLCIHPNTGQTPFSVYTQILVTHLSLYTPKYWSHTHIGALAGGIVIIYTNKLTFIKTNHYCLLVF